MVEEVQRLPFTAELDASDIEKGTYPHYMLKEIDEQPAVIRKIVQEYANDYDELVIEQSNLNALNEADRLYIIGCGTSYHAGMVGKNLIERLAKIPTEVHIASEFVYNMPLISENPLFIFISQSGETADSRAVLVNVKKLGYKALTMTNVPGSTLSREADYTLFFMLVLRLRLHPQRHTLAQVAVLLILAQVVVKSKGLETNLDLIS